MKKIRKMMMRTALLLLLCLAPSLAKAQVGEYRSALAVGVNGGVNLSSVGFTPTIKQGYLTGPNYGVTLLYTCEKYFKTICALQMEINYAQRGWIEDLDTSEGYPDNTYQRSITYVEVPLMAHLGWGKEERGLQFYFNAGPQFSYYLSDKETYGGSDEWDPTNRPNTSYQEVYGKEIENSFDYGIAGGLGIDLRTGIGHFMLEGRYYYGFGNIFSDTKKDPFSCSNNTVISVKLSYLIDLFKHK